MRKVAILIPTFNGVESLKKTVKSILKNTKYPHWRLIFIDGGSTDGTREYIEKLNKKYSNISYIFEEKKEGITKALIKGYETTKPDEDLFLTQNDIIFPQPNWLSQLVDRANEYNVGGIITTFNSIRKSGPDYKEGMPFVGTWCMYIPRETINKIGFLDDNFSPGPGDDIDYSFRVLGMGMGISFIRYKVNHHREVYHYNDKIEKIKQRNARYFRQKWNIPLIGVIGLGKLGLPLALIFSKSYGIYGYDINKELIKKLKGGINPYPYEKDLDKLLDRRSLYLLSIKNIVKKCDIFFIVTATPSKPNGKYDTQYVENVIKDIGKQLKKEKKYRLIVVVSTILPGDSKRLIELLEKISGKKCGKDFGYCYAPEFIAIGNIKEGMEKPDFVVIGASDKKAGSILEDVYKNICTNNPPIKIMNIVNAELTKIALNAFVTMKMSFANNLAELCEKIPYGNVEFVTDALGCDKRVGHKYLKGAAAYGGPCFPRDNRAFIQIAKEFGVHTPLSIATDYINERQNQRIVDFVLKFKPKNVSILGTTYKIDAPLTIESAGMKMKELFEKKGVKVKTYDPIGECNTKSIKECLKDSDFAILATPHEKFFKKFNKLRIYEAIKAMRNRRILDCWKVLPEFLLDMKQYAIGYNDAKSRID